MPGRDNLAAGLILAGGASSRMGRPKALLPVTAEDAAPTFVEALVAQFTAAGCAPLAVVTGAWAFDAPAPAFAVAAPDWALGMRASLRAGLRALPPAHGVLLTHVDRPCVHPSTLAALLAGPPEVSRVPFFDGRPGHPVFLDAGLCARLAAITLAEDDRPLAQWLAEAGAVRLDVDDPDVLLNVNTPEALAALHARRVVSAGVGPSTP